MPILIAHRGGPEVYPEQTVQSCRDALSAGADMAEMDIRLTADGEFVISHDASALRVFGTDRRVEDMPLCEFLSLRHKADPAFCSHSLQNVLDSGIGPMLFHCKVSGKPLERLADILLANGYRDRCVLGVTSTEDVKLIKLRSGFPVLAFMPGPDHTEEFARAGVDYIRLWEEWVTPESAETVKKIGKGLWIMAGLCTETGVGYTSAENLRYWVSLSADGILVNRIRWARENMK